MKYKIEFEYQVATFEKKCLFISLFSSYLY